MTLMIRYGMPESLKKRNDRAQCVRVLPQIGLGFFTPVPNARAFFCKRSDGFLFCGKCGEAGSKPERADRMNKAEGEKNVRTCDSGCGGDRAYAYAAFA